MKRAPARSFGSARFTTGFTLVELLVSTAVIVLIMLLLTGMTNQAASLWRRSSGKIEQFREARAAFESMTTRLSQATLNTYWDYDNALLPTKYQRRSELRFISGPASEVLGSAPGGKEWVTHSVFFQAPLGITEDAKFDGFENLLNTWGYFLEFSDDGPLRPNFLPRGAVPLRWRYRLMEFRQSSEKMNLFSLTSGSKPDQKKYAGKDWFRKAMGETSRPVRPVADNIIALIITPRLAQADEAEVKGGNTAANADESPLAPDYFYDSSPVASASDPRYKDARLNPIHQLPPVLQVTMVAIDEISTVRLNLGSGTTDAFKLADKFRRSADYSKDLLLSSDAASLEKTLISKQVNYRVMSTNVIIRGAKWSREQKN